MIDIVEVCVCFLGFFFVPLIMVVVVVVGGGVFCLEQASAARKVSKR